MLADRRRNGDRDPCRIEAAVVAADAAHIPCLVEDISQTGAKLRFRSEMSLPANLTLILPLFANVGEERATEVCWSAGTAVGVRFIAGTEDQAGAPDLASHPSISDS